MKPTTYAVFTRQRPGDDLILSGSVDAPNIRLARINAREIYDEEDWTDMIIVDEKQMVDVQAIEAPTTGAEGVTE